MAPVGIILFFAVFFSGVYLAGGSICWFFDTPSFILVFAIIFISLASSGRLSGFLKGMKFWFSGGVDADEPELENIVRAFDIAFIASLCSGAAGFLLWSILALINMSELPKAGPYMAMACITALLGIILSFQIFLPARTFFNNKIIHSRGI